MKTIQQLFCLLTLIAVTQASAALESAKFDPNNVMPQFPLTMEAAWITKGNLVVAVSLGVDGKVADTLVLGYTNEALVRPTLEAMKEWKATPARYNGEPVPVQIVLTFNFTLKGAVIYSTIFNQDLFVRFDGLGERAYVYRIHAMREIDQIPVLLNPVNPKYAAEAEKQGIRGTVRVYFYIDENGNVRMPSTDGEALPYLAEQAVAAVREWKFAPPTQHGQPVLVAASQEFKFDGSK